MSLPPSPPGYRLLEQIGHGGMALVYRAIQSNLSRPVAIKFLETRRGADAERFVERFRREALAASELNHRNIVTIHEFGDHGGDPFIVMELVDGFDLQSLIDEHLPVPPEILLLLLGEAVSGLAAAHARGIIHRDIKPANLLLSRSGDLKITDFGLARSSSLEQEHGGLTVHGSLLGTPAYMSPEQFLGMTLDARTDIYSLGVSAYVLLTGRLPFRGTTLMALQNEVLAMDPPPTGLVGQGADEMERLLRRMLAKERDERSASMRALAEEIETTLDALDPAGMLARRRRAFLERFGQDPHGLVRSLSGLDAEERLRRSAEIADAPVATLPEVYRRGDTESPPNESDVSAIVPLPRALDIEVLRAEDMREGASPPGARPDAPPAAARRRAPVPPPGPVLSRPAQRPARLAESARPVAPAAPPPRRSGRGLWIGAGALVASAALLVLAIRPLLRPADDALDLSIAAFRPDTSATPRGTSVEPEPTVADVSGAGIPAAPAALPAASPATSPAASPGSTQDHARDGAREDRDPVRVVIVPPPVSASAVRAKSFVEITCDPPGNVYVNDRLVGTGRDRALFEVPTDRSSTIVVRHPDLFASRTWSARPAPGDTVRLGNYALETGILRVTTHPPDPATLLIEGQESGDETPARRDVAAGRHLVAVARAGWRIEKVVILDRTDGTSREIVPSDPVRFPGAPVDVVAGHDHKVTFHLLPAQ